MKSLELDDTKFDEDSSEIIFVILHASTLFSWSVFVLGGFGVCSCIQPSSMVKDSVS